MVQDNELLMGHDLIVNIEDTLSMNNEEIKDSYSYIKSMFSDAVVESKQIRYESNHILERDLTLLNSQYTDISFGFSSTVNFNNTNRDPFPKISKKSLHPQYEDLTNMETMASTPSLSVYAIGSNEGSPIYISEDESPIEPPSEYKNINYDEDVNRVTGISIF